MKKLLLMAILLISIAGQAHSQAQEGAKLYLAVTYGSFFPSDNVTSQRFGSTWPMFGITYISPTKPHKWVPLGDVVWYNHSTGGSATLIPVTFGTGRAFGSGTLLQPYVAFRVGPYYGNVRAGSYGVDGAGVGFDANAAAGLIYQRRFYIEARYDYFTPIANTNFSGWSILGGIRVLDIDLK